jgi:hypothetical protein
MAEAAAATSLQHSPRVIRRIAALFTAAAIVLFALWTVPGLLDWSRYRGVIASFAAGQLGRPVQIDGAISVVLLPTPLVVASDVQLGDRGDGVAVSAPALRLRLALAPLLFGHLVPRDLMLSGAAIRLPWPLPAASGTGAGGWLGVSAARVEHGSVSLGALQLTDVDADLAPDRAAAGGVVISGTANWIGQSWRISAAIGARDPQGTAPFGFTLEALQDHAADSARFAGALGADGALAGRLTLQTEDLARYMPAPVVAASAEGTIQAVTGPIRGQFELKLGDIPITARLQPDAQGTGQAVALSAGTIDLDAWATALAHHRPARRATFLPALPSPVSLEISADAVRLHGGLVRAVRAGLVLNGAQDVLHSAAAVLPGEAQFTLTGGTYTTETRSLAAAWTLDAPQLRATLAWLTACGLHLGDLPPDVLRQAKLAGHLATAPGQVVLDALHGSVEQSTLGGRIVVDTASGAVEAALTTDHLDADDWLAPGASLRWPALSTALAGFALDLKLQAGDVQFRGETLHGLALDAATDAGGLALNGADFDIDGLHAHLAGTIGGDGQVTGGLLDLGSAQGAGFARHLPAWAQFTDYFWAGPVRLHAEANGPLDALIASVSLDVFDARLEAHPQINLTTGAWSAQLTLRHPGAPRLLEGMGFAGAGAWLGEGSLSMLAQLSGLPGDLKLDNYDLTAAALHATGALDWSRAAGATPALTGRVTADTLPLPGFAPHGTAPMPLGWLGGLSAGIDLSANLVVVGNAELLQNAHAALTLAKGVLKLDGLKATLGGGALTGGAQLDSTSSPPRLTADATLVGGSLDGGLFGTPIDLQSGRIDATVNLAGQGFSPASLLASLSGSVQLTATGGALAGFDTGAAAASADPASLKTALDSGVSPFDRLHVTAAIADGTVTLQQAAMTGPSGAAQFSGTIDLAGSALDLLAALPRGHDVRISGPAGAPLRR